MAGEEFIVIALVVMLLLLIFGFVVVARRYRTISPDEALVIFGKRRGDRSFVVVGPGGGKFIPPIVESFKVLSLKAHLVRIQVADVITRSGVPVTLDLVAVVGVSREKSKMEKAAVRVLSVSEGELANMMSEILAGHTRNFCATLEVEQINADRDALGAKIRELAGSAVADLGIDIVAFVVKDVADQVGYLEALGKRRTAEVKRDAIIHEAAARRDAVQQTTEYDVQSQKIRFKADAEIAAAQAERDAAIEASKKEVAARYARAK